MTDGTNTVSTSGLLASGGAAADINSGSTTIDGGKISTNSVIANVVLQGGTVQVGAGAVPGGWAFRVGTGGVVESDNLFTNSVACYSPSSRSLAAISGNHAGANVGVLGRINYTNGSTSAHGVRGTNSYTTGSRVQTSGLIGAANGYDFYAEGAGTNYGPFTGAHDCLVANNSTVALGDLVVDLMCITRRGLSNTLFSVTTSSQLNQAAVLGVAVSDNGALSTQKPSAFIDSISEENGVVMNDEYNLVKNDYKLMAVNAVGEGQINVIGQGGNLSPGDLIVASSTAGKGMKQTDDFVRSYTVARARESVSFDSPGEVKMVACIYLCG